MYGWNLAHNMLIDFVFDSSKHLVMKLIVTRMGVET